MKYLKNLYYLFTSLYSYIAENYSQKKFVKNFKPLQDLLYKSRYSLRGNALNHLKDYCNRLYILIAVPSSNLEGYQISYSERSRLVLLGAFASIYDNFIDITRANIAKLKILVKNPNYYIPINIKEETGHEALKLLLKYYNGNIKRIFPSVFKTHLMQIQSKKQRNEDIEYEELKKIIYAKGGYTALLCRNMIDKPISKIDYHMWYQYGVFLQLSDDIFDMKKDFDEGIKTLANTSEKISEINDLLDKEFLACIKLVHQTIYSMDNKKEFIYRIALFYIIVKGLLHQIKRKTRRLNYTINLNKLKRKDFNFNFFSIRNYFYLFKLTVKLNI